MGQKDKKKPAPRRVPKAPKEELPVQSHDPLGDYEKQVKEALLGVLAPGDR